MRIDTTHLKVFTPLVLIVLMNTGCITFYSYEKVHFRLTGRIDKKPVSDAKVEVFYNYIALLNPPQPEYAYTNVNGQVTLNIAFDSWPIGYVIPIEVNDEFYAVIDKMCGEIMFHDSTISSRAKKKYNFEIQPNNCP